MTSYTCYQYTRHQSYYRGERQTISMSVVFENDREKTFKKIYNEYTNIRRRDLEGIQKMVGRCGGDVV